MAIDIKARKPKLANRTGGLSGPVIKPVADRLVYEVFKVVTVRVIGMGGIMHADDAIEFLLEGATAVAVGTANFVNPRAAIDILEGIMTFMKDEKVEDIIHLRRAAHAT